MILLDVLIGIFMMMIATLGFLSLFPLVKRSQVASQQESIAVQLSNRMLEHLQMLRPADVNSAVLTQLNLVDADQSGPTYTFTNVPLDEASHYSPSQALKGGQGVFTITNLTSGSLKVDLEVSYLSPWGTRRRVTTGTIIGGFR
jgi:Tfp pilus assembly protein PilV